MPTDERVLAIPTERFRAAGYFQGYRAADRPFLEAVLAPDAFSFRPRSEVETDSNFKQLIPYVVLRCGESLFHYRRRGGNEARLRSLRSVGVGGHVGEADAAGAADAYRAGMARELAEEVDVRSAYTERLIGFINDDTVPVGRMHLGVVHLFELAEPNAVAKEEAIADAGFAPLQALVAERDEFETWSQFVFGAIAKGDV